MFASCWRRLVNWKSSGCRTVARRKTSRSLRLEQLEDRCVPSYTFKPLASFNVNNGANPRAGLVEDSSGNLFGTTHDGGAYRAGTVFELPAGSGTIKDLASFNGGTNGANPNGSLVEDSTGNLFGTTYTLVVSQGTVFEVAAGSGTITDLASFNGGTNGTNPNASLVEDNSGNLFGTTYDGGLYGDGTVFEWVASSGSIKYLAAFNGTNGKNPNAGLVEDSNGNLFGTTEWGGKGSGTVFEWVASSGTIQNLASFDGNDGAEPYGLFEDSSGNLFGATVSGGLHGDGTVYEVPAGSGTIKDLASFDGSNGTQPHASLIEDSNGNLFGTTEEGGANNGGTVFEWLKSSGTIQDLAPLTGGSSSSLVEDSSGNLFGTTEQGGDYSKGSVFELVDSIGLSPNPLPAAAVGASYNQTVTASGGTAPYTFAVTAGSLPAGLTLSSTGVLSGTPTALGSSSFIVTATDSTGASGSQAYTLPVYAIALNPSTLSAATAGASYSQPLTASGGTAPYTFAVTAGALPAGLSLATDGVLSGTPAGTGSFTFTITATDSSSPNLLGSQAYTLTVNPATLALGPSMLPAATVGAGYSQTLSASAGTAPYTFAVTGGALPAGLSLSTDGVLSGTPLVSGSFTFTVTATDSSSPSLLGIQAYTLTVMPLSPDQQYLRALYLYALGRPGSPAEWASWEPLLSQPDGRFLVAYLIEHSFEARDRLVQSWYALYLGRQAVRGEELGWLSLFLAGATEEQVLAGILASPEYFLRTVALSGSVGAPSAVTFVEALYTGLLQRPGSAAEIAFWAGEVEVVGGYAVANAILHSAEYRTLVVRSYYTLFLGRQPSPAELLGWVYSPLDLTDIRGGFESSQEFYLRMIGFTS